MNKKLLIPLVVFALISVGVSFALGAFLGNPFVATPEIQLPAEAIFKIGVFPITNSLIATWITMAVLILFFWGVKRKLKLIPGRIQSIAENVLNWLYELCVDTAGEKNGRKFFPLVATIFLFVVVNAWMNLIPGYGSILVSNGAGSQVPLLRGANTDLNLPLALALITFAMVEWWGLKALGVFNYLSKFFNFKPLINAIGHREGVMALFNGVLAIFVGLLELLLEFVRIISLTFRLFGNMTGGEVLVLMVTFLLPFLIPVAAYGMESFFGFVQALVFAGLALVFAVVAVTPHSEHDEVAHNEAHA